METLGATGGALIATALPIIFSLAGCMGGTAERLRVCADTLFLPAAGAIATGLLFVVPLGVWVTGRQFDARAYWLATAGGLLGWAVDALVLVALQAGPTDLLGVASLLVAPIAGSIAAFELFGREEVKLHAWAKTGGGGLAASVALP